MHRSISDEELHARIACLLRTRDTGARVSRAVQDHYEAWQYRTVVADLRAGRAQNAYDEALDRQEGGRDRATSQAIARLRLI